MRIALRMVGAKVADATGFGQFHLVHAFAKPGAAGVGIFADASRATDAFFVIGVAGCFGVHRAAAGVARQVRPFDQPMAD